jgi:hypothetical protein
MNKTPLEDQVHDALHRRVDPIQHAPLSVTDVRRRARRIRRNRAIGAGVAVAAALAIAVPAGLTMTGAGPRSGIEPASPSPSPAVTGTVRIDPRSAPIGDPTAVTLVDVVAPSVTIDGETTDLPETYDQITPYLDGWIAVVNDEGLLTYQQLSADFTVMDEFSPVSPLTVSADRARIAFAQYDGDHWSVVDLDATGAREERLTSFPPGPEVAAVRPVGFLPDSGLVVAQTDPSTGDEAAIVVSPDGTTRRLDGFIKPISSSPVSGLLAGQTSFTGDGSCWRVGDAGAGGGGFGAVAWETCNHSLGEFAPDGNHLAAFAPYSDGGSPTMAILDADTGQPVVDFEVAGARNQLAVVNPEVVWEDDAHLVTTVVTGNRQYVLRLGLDGTVERLTDAAPEDPTMNPIKLMP